VLMTGLRHLQEESPAIGDVRGRGLMVATEFTTPDGQQWGARAKAVIQTCYQKDLLLLSCGYDGQIVRWIPPLVVNEAQVHEALAIFADALAETE
jgi:4-aminobutyrate aminotransferase